LRALRRRFPQARIVFLMEPNLRDLVRGGDWMDETVCWPAREHRSILHREYRDLVRDLRARRFEWAVLLPNSLRSALMARLAGAGRRIGYRRDGRGLLLTDRLPVKNRRRKADRGRGVQNGAFAKTVELGGPRIWPGPHVAVRMGQRLPADLGPYWPMPLVEYYADLAEAIGCERPGDGLELFTTADCDDSIDRLLSQFGLHRGRPLVVISPGAKFGASKCWMPDRFAAVADWLIEKDGAAVVITCGPGEERIAQAIASAMRSAPHAPGSSKAALVLDDPPLNLGQLKSLIRRCDLLLCNDAGPRHFAKAFTVPVVTVFGPTHPDWTATGYQDERIVRMDVDCGPCQQKNCPLGHHQCLTGIPPEVVYAAAAEMLRLRRAGAPRADHEHVHG
jgi:heptosyltransferase-2